MNNYQIISLFILCIFISIGLSQNDKKVVENERLSFKLKYDKGMKFSKKVTYSVLEESKGVNDDEIFKSTKEVSIRNITINEIKDDLPSKIKYEFGETEVYENGQKNDSYDDKLKGHWFEGVVDRLLKVEVEKKSENFPENNDSRYFFDELKRHGFLRFYFLKNVQKEVNSEWVVAIQFNSKEECRYNAMISLKMTLSNVYTVNNEKFAIFTFYFDNCSGSMKIVLSGLIKVNVTKSRIVNWEIEIENKYSKSKKKNYLLSCEFTYEEPKQDGVEEKNEKVIPKSEDE